MSTVAELPMLEESSAVQFNVYTVCVSIADVVSVVVAAHVLPLQLHESPLDPEIVQDSTLAAAQEMLLVSPDFTIPGTATMSADGFGM